MMKQLSLLVDDLVNFIAGGLVGSRVVRFLGLVLYLVAGFALSPIIGLATFVVFGLFNQQKLRDITQTRERKITENIRDIEKMQKMNEEACEQYLAQQQRYMTLQQEKIALQGLQEAQETAYREMKFYIKKLKSEIANKHEISEREAADYAVHIMKNAGKFISFERGDGVSSKHPTHSIQMLRQLNDNFDNILFHQDLRVLPDIGPLFSERAVAIQDKPTLKYYQEKKPQADDAVVEPPHEGFLLKLKNIAAKVWPPVCKFIGTTLLVTLALAMGVFLPVYGLTVVILPMVLIGSLAVGLGIAAAVKSVVYDRQRDDELTKTNLKIHQARHQYQSHHKKQVKLTKKLTALEQQVRWLQRDIEQKWVCIDAKTEGFSEYLTDKFGNYLHYQQDKAHYHPEAKIAFFPKLSPHPEVNAVHKEFKQAILAH